GIRSRGPRRSDALPEVKITARFRRVSWQAAPRTSATWSRSAASSSPSSSAPSPTAPTSAPWAPSPTWSTWEAGGACACGCWRSSWIDPVATDLAARHVPRQDLPTIIAALSGASLPTVEMIVAAAVAGALLVFVFKDREFRSSFDHVLGGTVVGLTIVGGWYV